MNIVKRKLQHLLYKTRRFVLMTRAQIGLRILGGPQQFDEMTEQLYVSVWPKHKHYEAETRKLMYATVAKAWTQGYELGKKSK